MLAMLLTLQAVETATLPDASMAGFDLATAKPSDTDTGCKASNLGGDILICGRRKNMDIDISGMPDFAEKPIRAGVDVAPGTRVSVEGEQRNVGGFTSKAATVKLRIGF